MHVTTRTHPSFLVLTALSTSLLAAGTASGDVIPANRRIDWTQCGIPGGVPNRTAIAATISAATYGNGTTDATAAIQSALNSSGVDGVVSLSAGTFRIDGSLHVPSQVTLRGAGPQQTILDAHGSGAAVVSFGQNATPYAANSVAITGGTGAGSNSITVASAAGIAVGSCLLITELNDTSFVSIVGGEGSCTWCDGGISWNGTRTLGQIVEVTSVSATTVGITPSLYVAYAASLSPLATRFDAGAKYAGVEDLQVYVNNTGYTANFFMGGSAYCWIKNVESNYTDGDHVQAYWSYRCEIRDSYFHDAYHHTPGQTDADVFIADKSSGFLVENNILRRMHVSIMLNWGAAGNVIGYNYSAGDFDENAYNVVMGDLSMHGSHPMFNLYEGNIATSFHPDGIWGSNSHNTVFRNWLLGTTRISKPLSGRGPEQTDSTWWACQANRAVSIDFAGRYYNIVGNVVGSNDLLQLTSYNNGRTRIPAVRMIVAPQNRSYDATTYCYGFGYSEASDDGSYAEDNNKPYLTALLHGNYDFASGTTVWDTAIASHALPASLYRTAKPSWWGNLAWPAIGPDTSNPAIVLQGEIPASVRYKNSGAGVRPARVSSASQPVLRLYSSAPLVLGYQIPAAGVVLLEVYTVAGRRVQTLVNAYRMAGRYAVTWSPGQYLAGAYVVRLSVGGYGVSGRLVR
jgi:hypothetical protein